MSWLLLTGLLSSAAQVVLLREANVAFYGVELVYLLAIGIWMLWTGLGAAFDRGRRQPPGMGAIVALVLCLGLVLPAEVAFLRASRMLAGGVPGAYLPFTRQLSVLVAAIFPVGVALGLLFQWTARRAVASGWSLAEAYAVESVGALAGGVATVVWTHAHLSTLGLALTASTACAAVGVFTFRRSPGWARLASIVAAAASLFVVARVGTIDDGMTRWTHPFMVESRDSPYGRLTLTRAAEQVAVFENDALSFETGGTDAELLAHVAALSHPAPSRMLLLGGGPEGIGRELVRHHPDRLDIVEVNPVLLEMARRELPGALPAQSPAVSVTVDEPRRFLRTASAYDLVVVSAPEPDSGQANRFYTSEFFAGCAARLREGGLLAFRLRTAENIWTPAQALRFASVYRALRAHFEHVLVLPGTVNVVLASQQPLPADATPLIARLSARRLQTRLVQPAFLEYLFSNDRRDEIERVLERTWAPPNTDVAPVCYRYALILWAGRFWPSLAGLDPSEPWANRLGRQALAGALVVVVLLLGFCRRTRSRRRAMYVAVIALGGMFLESVVLMYYQVTQGVVFQDIGMLTAAFMAGLAAGTWAARREFAGARVRWMGVGIALAVGAAGALVASVVATSGAPTLVTASLLLLAAGGLVGAAFGWASVAAGPDQRGAIAPLYAADLVGGALGAVVGGLLLIPLLGLTATALVGGALALLAAVVA